MSFKSSTEIEVDLNGTKYVVPSNGNVIGFYINSPDGGSLTVNKTTAAELVAASEAYSTLGYLFNSANAMSQPATWMQISKYAEQVNALEAVGSTLWNMAGATAAFALGGEAEPVFIKAEINTAAELGYVTTEIAVAYFGMTVASGKLSDAYSKFSEMEAITSQGGYIEYDNIANSINETLSALTLGESMGDATAVLGNFEEKTGQQILDWVDAFASSVSDGIEKLLSPKQLVILKTADQLQNLQTDEASLVTLANVISSSVNYGVSGFSPLTSSGISSIIDKIAGAKYIDSSANIVHTVSTSSTTNTTPTSLPATPLSDDYGNSAATAAAMAMGRVIYGTIETPGDQDWLSVQLQAGHEYGVAVTGAAERGMIATPGVHLYLVNASGSVLVDAESSGNTANFAYSPNTSGTYYLEVTALTGQQTGGYVLAASDDGAPPPVVAPTPSAGPVGLNLGTTDYQASEDGGAFRYQINVDSPVTAPITVEWQVTGYGNHPTTSSRFSATSGTLTLQPGHDQYGFNVLPVDDNINQGDQDFRVNISVVSGNAVVNAGVASGTVLDDDAGKFTPSVDEPNVDFADATILTPETWSSGAYINTPGDTDYYAINLTAGATYRLNLWGSDGSVLGQPHQGVAALQAVQGALYDSNHNLIASSFSTPVQPQHAYIDFTPTQSGTYYIVARGASNSDTGLYYLFPDTMVKADDYASNPGTTGTMTPDVAVHGDIERAGDDDWFGVQLQAGHTYAFSAVPDSTGTIFGVDYAWPDWGAGSPFSLKANLYDSSGKIATGPANTTPYGSYNYTTFTPTASGEYYFSVSMAGFVNGYVAEYHDVTAAGPGSQPTVVQLNSSNSTAVTYANVHTDSDVAPTLSDTLKVGGYSGSGAGTALKFNLSGLPAQAAHAYIDLYFTGAGSDSAEAYVLGAPTGAWSATSNLSALGGFAFEGVVAPPASPGWYKIDITNLYNEWQSGAAQNNGIVLFADYIYSSQSQFWGPSYTGDPSLRPKLEVDPLNPLQLSAHTINASLVATDQPTDIVGTSGNDVLIGGAGNDLLDGQGGADVIDGGAGQNTVTYAASPSGVSVDLQTNQNHGGWAEGDSIQNVEAVIGSAFADTLVAGLTDTSLAGGAGNDTLVSGAGNDTLDGGSGVDTAVYSGNFAAYTVTPSGGGYTVSGPDGTDTLTNIEILKFSDRQLVLGHNAETLTLQASDFNAHGVSDFLIENTGGAVFVGEAQNGQAAYTQVAGLGSEWSFHGRGDFLGNGDSDFLIQNTSGAVAVGDVHNGQTSYTVVAGLGSEWSFKGAGDFLGDGKSDFLIENTSGSVVVGEVVSGHAQYTAVAGLGPEWSFRGAGDFLGNGKSDFLIENTSGVVAVGEVAGGQAQYTAIASLGHEWSFKETGDFLGDGKDDFLIENTSGSVVVGEAVGGQAQYTAVTSLGPEWKFVGAGDYLGEGHEQFLIENSSGAIDIGDWTGGQVHFTNIAGLGPEWVFH